MNSLRTQLRKKTPSVAALPWKFSNPFRNNQSGRKALSRATNSVLDIFDGTFFEKSIYCQASASSIQIIGILVNTINNNLLQAEQ